MSVRGEVVDLGALVEDVVVVVVDVVLTSWCMASSFAFFSGFPKVDKWSV